MGSIKLKVIPAGEFLMGSPDDDKDAAGDEKPRHSVRITRAFYLGVHEVTRGQFRRFVDDTGYKTEGEMDGKGSWGGNTDQTKFEQSPRYTWQNAGFDQTDEHPVVNVSWNDAQAFTSWLSRKEGETFRLPTEAEWEYACRAGSTTRYTFGNDAEGLAAVGNVFDGTANEKFPQLKSWPKIVARDGHVHTAPVGRYKPNAWGLFDMHGNVWEWCSDGYAADYYQRSPTNDPSGSSLAPQRVFARRVLDWHPRDDRSAVREKSGPEFRSTHNGFRVARDARGSRERRHPATPVRDGGGQGT